MYVQLFHANGKPWLLLVDDIDKQFKVVSESKLDVAGFREIEFWDDSLRVLRASSVQVVGRAGLFGRSLQNGSKVWRVHVTWTPSERIPLQTAKARLEALIRENPATYDSGIGSEEVILALAKASSADDIFRALSL